MSRWKLQAKKRSYLLIEAVLSCALIVTSISFLGHSIFSQQKLTKKIEAFERDVQIDACIAYVKRALSKNPNLALKLAQEKSVELEIPAEGHFITRRGQKIYHVCLFQEKKSRSERLNYALVRMKVGKEAKKKGPLIRLALSKAISIQK